MEGIEKFANIIELIKKKNKINAQKEYRKYSKMPKTKAKEYIANLEKKILKGDVDVGNISDEELKLFNQKPSIEDRDQAKKETRNKIIIGVVAAVAIICFSLFSESTPATPDKISAWSIAKQFVEGKMDSPSTAEFPWYDKSFVKDLGECTFRVSAYVDGQNVFGAIIRNKFSLTVKNETCNKNDKWQLISINMY